MRKVIFVKFTGYGTKNFSKKVCFFCVIFSMWSKTSTTPFTLTVENESSYTEVPLMYLLDRAKVGAGGGWTVNRGVQERKRSTPNVVEEDPNGVSGSFVSPLTTQWSLSRCPLDWVGVSLRQGRLGVEREPFTTRTCSAESSAVCGHSGACLSRNDVATLLWPAPSDIFVPSVGDDPRVVSESERWCWIF